MIIDKLRRRFNDVPALAVRPSEAIGKTALMQDLEFELNQLDPDDNAWGVKHEERALRVETTIAVFCDQVTEIAQTH
jgi:hypothetical protein